MRRHLSSALLVLTTILVPTAAWGISYGEPDDGTHPNVAALVVAPTDPASGTPLPRVFCSGTLVDRDTVVTAAHCAAGVAYFYPGAPTYVTFADVVDADQDGVVDADVPLVPGTPVPHPRYGVTSSSNPYDLAVFQLDRPITSITPATLPTAGYLDDRAVRSRTFTAVGYGVERDTNRTGWQALGSAWRRMRTDQTLNSVTSNWVTFSMNQATGDGGTCSGDSGGPHFLGATMVSITVKGDTYCKATDKTYRLDTPWAREFLASYVSLP